MSPFHTLWRWMSLLGLQCWHCVADDCNKDPDDNYKAVKKDCEPGQACQVRIIRALEISWPITSHTRYLNC